jgi:heme oxygenase
MMERTDVRVSDQPMARLRNETREPHRALERTETAQALFSGRIARAAYAEVLSTFRVAYRALANALAISALEPVRALAATLPPRLEWLESDLRVLDEARARPPARATGLAEAIIDAADRRGVVGAVYVLEGSALGGQVLVRRLTEAGAVPRDALRYYRGLGPETPLAFMAFGQRAEELLASPDDCDDAVVVARRVFREMHACFDDIGAQRAPEDPIASTSHVETADV